MKIRESCYTEKLAILQYTMIISRMVSVVKSGLYCAKTKDYFAVYKVDKVAQLVGLVISRSLVQFPASALWSALEKKTVYSILPQSTQLQHGYLALIRQCLELARYRPPTAPEYPSGD